MSGEMVVQVGGRVQWKFTPAGLQGADEIVTPRLTHYPPAPQGATLLLDGQVFGTVRCVRRRAFNRYVIVYDPVAQPQPQTIAEPLQALAEQPPVSSAEPVVESAVVDDLDELGLPGWVTTALREAGFTSVVALDGLDEAALREIPHIGGRSATSIRVAVDKWLGAREDV